MIRLETLEQENARLKRIVAEQALDISVFEGPGPGKLLSLTRRRDAIAYLIKKSGVSERRSCQLVGQHRSTNRCTAVPVEFEIKLVARMTKLA